MDGHAKNIEFCQHSLMGPQLFIFDRNTTSFKYPIARIQDIGSIYLCLISGTERISDFFYNITEKITFFVISVICKISTLSRMVNISINDLQW